MSHLTTELCVKYPGERIPQWEYEFEAKEWAAAGFHPTALAEGTRHRLPRGCYFSQDGTKQQVLATWERITARLARRVRMECTIGLSFGKDLAPLKAQAVAAAEVEVVEATATSPAEVALSSAFNKLFGSPVG